VTRSGPIERFAARPLPVAELEIARRDVVQAGVAEDVIEGVGLADSTRRPTDDDRQLRLVVDLRGQRRIPADLGPVADHRARPLAEDERGRRRVRAFLVDVITVVAPDGDDLAGARDRAQEHYVPKRAPGLGDHGRVGDRRQCREQLRATPEQVGHRRWSGRQERPRRQPAVPRDDAERVAARASAIRHQPHLVDSTITRAPNVQHTGLWTMD
jgi:hypothetical protein